MELNSSNRQSSLSDIDYLLSELGQHKAFPVLMKQLTLHAELLKQKLNGIKGVEELAISAAHLTGFEKAITAIQNLTEVKKK